MCTCGAKTCRPRLSSRKDDLRYRLPPETAATKLPIRPVAIGASNSTGQVRVPSFLPLSRRTVRVPAMRPTDSADSSSAALRALVYQ
jgi:hypothetical protein